MRKSVRARYSAVPDGYDVYDMHIHTNFSDGIMSPKTVVRRAKELAIGISITDHNEIRGSVACGEHSAGVDVVPGIELATDTGVDLLAYFAGFDELERFYKGVVEGHQGADPSSFTDLRADYLIRAVADHAGLSYLAHPFGYMWKSWSKTLTRLNRKTIGLIHGVEGLNGAMSGKRNELALNLAERLRKPLVAGSDAHMVGRIGECVTLLPAADAPAYERLKAGLGICRYRPDLKRWTSGLIEPMAIFGLHARHWPKIAHAKYRRLSGFLR